ncbi:MAG: multicopper oxidase domain-containing protein [Candidatus Magasanikbacteria bacterium]|nr:multicopper oxidase domain-containing protein [Candidatus Magasanikbacteria bacterium]
MKNLRRPGAILVAISLVCVALLFLLLTANLFFLKYKVTPTQTAYIPQTRTYFIAAENVLWDYAPSGKDPYTNEALPAPWGEQTKYKKVRFIEYTDDTFTTKKIQPEWLGILGPIIRAVEGDTIKVDFYNKADKPYSIHPHGVHYDKDNEGASMGSSAAMMGADKNMEGAGAKIMPGEKFTYTWFATPDSAPQPSEGGSKVWWYHSHVDITQDVYDGLLGPIIITSAKNARPDGTPNDVDKEFVTIFMIFDESKPGMTADQKEGGLKHTINGYIFDNLPGLTMNEGDKVRWHLLGMGNEMDVHTAHWHGGVVLSRESNTYTDVVELLPGSMKTVDMLATNVGEWMYHCHVKDHIIAGMIAVYKILPRK